MISGGFVYLALNRLKDIELDSWFNVSYLEKSLSFSMVALPEINTH